MRQYRKLDPSVKRPIQVAIDALQHAPLTRTNIKRLKGRLRDYWRVRVGDYRVVYAVDHQAKIVYIDYMQHRKDVYR